MLKRLRSLLNGKKSALMREHNAVHILQHAPYVLTIDGQPSFSFSEHLSFHYGLPVVDWDAVQAWVDGMEAEGLRPKAWALAEQAWLLHLRESLGARFCLFQTETSALLSSLDKNAVVATLDYMNRTLKRITTVLDGIADVPPWGSDILIVFEDEEQYYTYVSYYYPEDGEYAFSGGMFINSGCSHFVTVKSDLRSIEPVIAHEMTHACLSHLPLPLWLNEGLAVNTEHRLTGKTGSIYSPQEMREKHLSYWGIAEIQEFWAGDSFSRTDDGNMLSYDLARILVEQFAKDWSQFKQFVLAADWQDGGAAAAQDYLGVSLGEAVATLLEKQNPVLWEPKSRQSKNMDSVAVCVSNCRF
jgi:hypothetical protein